MFVAERTLSLYRPLIEQLEPRQLLTASISTDLTIGIVSSSTGSFVGGDPGSILVSIANDGAQLAIGTEIIRLYVSPDQSVANGTLITAVQNTGKISGGSSTELNIPFIF